MAQGSHKTYGGWEDKTCCKCGGKLTLAGPACLWSLDPKTGLARSWHLGKCP